MFIASLPHIFFYSGIIQPLGLGLLFAAIFALAYTNAPEPDSGWVGRSDQSVYDFLRSAWSGNESLWRIFWPFLMLVIGIYYYIDYRVININFTIASWKTVHGMLILPFVWWVVAIWRSSSNTGYKIFSASARAIAIYLIIASALRVYLSLETPEVLFDCKLLVLEYGDC